MKIFKIIVYIFYSIICIAEGLLVNKVAYHSQHLAWGLLVTFILLLISTELVELTRKLK